MASREKNRKLSLDVLAILIFCLAVLTLISLVTYSSLDPSFSNSIREKVYYNALGWFGAHLADLIFLAFGYMGYIVPLFLTFLSYVFLFRRFGLLIRLQTIGILFLFLVITSLVTLIIPVSEDFKRYYKSGGSIGSLLLSILTPYLGNFGSALVLVFVSLILIVLIFRVSPSTIVETIFYVSGVVFDWIRRTLKLSYSFLYTKVIEYIERRHRKIERLKEAERKEEIEKIVKKSKEPKFVNELSKGQKRKMSVKSDQMPLMKQSGKYTLPPLSLLHIDESQKERTDAKTIELSIQLLEKKLNDFGVEGKVSGFQTGPVVTVYEYEPAAGVKINQIVNLSDDLALALRAQSIRILAPIPGKSVVGIEIPNTHRETVFLKEILSSKDFQMSDSRLTLALGKDVTGQPVVTDLEKMPHLLIAGATGSGKSVCLHTLINSILYKSTPDEVKFIMIDPKMLELPVYDGLPHLMHEVVVDVKDAARVLKWAVRCMEERYEKLKENGVKNVISYREAGGNDMPIIVIAIDELADLMMVVGKDVEDSIGRLAQKARAAGIHLIVATQRPSVDIITGTIKANLPARIAFKVPSKTDSRTILDANGAEALLGKGDMLLMLPNEPGIKRVHGAFISESEVKSVVEHWKSQAEPEYDSSILKVEELQNGLGEVIDEDDEMYPDALNIVKEAQYASISYIQRRLRIGYNRAARIMERMEKEGVIRRVGNNKWEIAGADIEPHND
jgi:S-DNA-T family DNA segregation ATPase FtsK/SpoIIIE